jgi:predicted porin
MPTAPQPWNFGLTTSCPGIGGQEALGNGLNAEFALESSSAPTTARSAALAAIVRA